jgi:signal transduction histidine kinase
VTTRRPPSGRRDGPSLLAAMDEYRDYREVTMESSALQDDYPDADEMVAYLQASIEKTNARLSRELHDEMGGLLVSAVMDVAFAEQALPVDDRLRQRLARARSTLAAAIDLKRKTIETLRPSILDNFGLFEAIKWEIKQESRRTHVPCSEIYPDSKPAFTRDAAIGLFRIVQEALGVALRQPAVRGVHIELDIDADNLRISVRHDGDGADHPLTRDDEFAMCSVSHRVRAFGGQMAIAAPPGGGARYSATMPLSRLITPPKPAAKAASKIPTE